MNFLSEFFRSATEKLLESLQENGHLMASGMAKRPFVLGEHTQVEIRAGSRFLWAPFSDAHRDELEIWAVVGPELSRSYRLELRSLISLWAAIAGESQQTRMFQEVEPILQRANLAVEGHAFALLLPALRLRVKFETILPELLDVSPSLIVGGGTDLQPGVVLVRLLDFADGGHFVGITGVQLSGSLNPLRSAVPAFTRQLDRLGIEFTGTVGAVYVSDSPLGYY